MKEYDIQRMMRDPKIIEDKLQELTQKKLLFEQAVDKDEIKGHILKADHNLRFVATISREKFYDWALTGCYYTCYHAALALIQTKGYHSKNHLATLCVIIKEFYRHGLTEEDIEILSDLLDYQDVLFYVETKNRREDATYSTRKLFEKHDVEKLRMQAAIFVNKIKAILADNEFI